MKTMTYDYEKLREECEIQCGNYVLESEKRCVPKWWVRQETDIEPEVNDAPICVNHSGVKNSEWGCLHLMLVEILLGFLKGCKCRDSLWSFGIDINLKKKRWKSWLNKREVKKYGLSDSEYETDYHISEHIDSPDELDEMLVECVSEFLDKHNLWGESFGFGFDDIAGSLKEGKWMPCSDSSISLCDKNDEFIVLSM